MPLFDIIQLYLAVWTFQSQILSLFSTSPI